MKHIIGQFLTNMSYIHIISLTKRLIGTKNPSKFKALSKGSNFELPWPWVGLLVEDKM